MEAPLLPEHPPLADAAAEVGVLGSALRSRTAAERALEMLRPEDFFLRSHQRIFQVIAELHEKEHDIDPLTVEVRLRERGWLESVGGAEGLWQIEGAAPTSVHLESYAKPVRDLSLKRQFKTAGERVIALAHEQGRTPQQVAEEAEALLVGIRVNRGLSQPVAANELFLAVAGTYIPGSEPVPAISTGYSQLDFYLGGGLRDGNLILVAGRPSMGKSAAGMELCANAAEAGFPALLYSLEDPRETTVERWLAAYAEVDTLRLRTRQYAPDQWSRLTRTFDRLRGLPLWVEDNPELTLPEIRQQIRELQRQHGLRLVVIDQLQTMVLPDGENENVQVTKQAYALQRMARRLNLPVVLQCQLNRANTRRSDPRPTMADLRSSGSLEQAAHVIILLHRQAYYDRAGSEPPAQYDPTDWIIAKNRNGPVGTVTLGFERRFTRFVEIDTRYGDAEAPPERNRWEGDDE